MINDIFLPLFNARSFLAQGNVSTAETILRGIIEESIDAGLFRYSVGLAHGRWQLLITLPSGEVVAYAFKSSDLLDEDIDRLSLAKIHKWLLDNEHRRHEVTMLEALIEYELKHDCVGYAQQQER